MDRIQQTTQGRESTARAAYPDDAAVATSGLAFERRLAVQLVVGAVGAVVLVFSYLTLVLEMTPAQWAVLRRVVTIAVPILIAPALWLNWSSNRPVRDWLDAPSPDAESARAAYRALARIPRQLFAQTIALWLVGAAAVVLIADLIAGDLDTYMCGAMFVAGCAAGFVNAVFAYFSVKHSQRSLLSLLADRVGPARRADVATVSLRAKLWISAGGITLAATGFAACLAVGAASAPLEGNALRVMSRALDLELGELVELGRSDFDRVQERLAALGIASDLAVVDLRSGELVWGSRQVLTAAELAHVRGASGDSGQVTSPNVFAWRAVDGAHAVVASLPWADVRGSAGLMQFQLVLVFAIAAGLATLIVRLLARDLEGSVHSIVAMVQEVARGDLRERLPVESEDELGELGAACDAMADELRRGVAGVVETADALESQASSLSNYAMEVATGAGEQLRGVQGVTLAVDVVRDQVAAIDSGTRRLDGSVEDANQGVAEISASSRALDEMAEGFGTRIRETSDSVEELVRSVRAVGENTAELSGAAARTTQRMRSMATAMHEIDEQAAEGVELSERAYASAEAGRQRVQDTLQGMETIRSATDTASGVMRLLVERVREIDSILDVIEDVAEETNLLALNAAIIAAQAGDQGRAFSVVADEIKELAERVFASTKEIAQVVHAVQAESLNAARAIEQNAETVTSGLERSREADRALDDITLTSREAGARISGIVASVRLQSEAARDVVALMQKVSDESASIGSAMNQQSRGNQFILDAANGMRDLAEQLKRTTAAQAHGTAGVLGHIEGVGSSAAVIVAALGEQVAACERVADSLAPVADGATSHEATAKRLGLATHALREQANRLRSDIDRFILE